MPIDSEIGTGTRVLCVWNHLGISQFTLTYLSTETQRTEIKLSRISKLKTKYPPIQAYYYRLEISSNLSPTTHFPSSNFSIFQNPTTGLWRNRELKTENEKNSTERPLFKIFHDERGIYRRYLTSTQPRLIISNFLTTTSFLPLISLSSKT